MDRLAGPLVLAARVAFSAAAAICVIGMVGPFQSVETALVPWDKAAHFIAFYGLTSLLFVAFPRRRRTDLAMWALLLGCGVEIAQRMSGRDAELADIAADALGVVAVLAPVYIEAIRARARGVKLSERRRGLGRRTADALAPVAGDVRPAVVSSEA